MPAEKLATKLSNMPRLSRQEAHVLMAAVSDENPMPEAIDFVYSETLSDLDAYVRAGAGGAKSVLIRGANDDDTLAATLAALACFGIAGHRAGQQAKGPGSFQVAFLDALYQLTPEDLSSQSQVETLHAV